MQKIFLALLFSFLCAAPVLGNPSLLNTFEDYVTDGYETITHHFGGLHLIKEAEGLTESVVYWPFNGYLSEANHILDVYSTMVASFSQPEKYSTDDIISCNIGETSDYFKFAPYFVGAATFGSVANFTSPCFGTNTLTLYYIDHETVVLEHNASNASSILCSDAFFMSTSQNYHWTNIFFHGTHRTTFRGLSKLQMQEITRTGIQIFRVCDSISHVVPDVIKTLLLFVGGFSTNPHLPFIGSHPTFWMVRANVDFIERATGYKWEKRQNNSVIMLDPEQIHSGDFFAVTRFDGLDQIIQWGAGSHAGHSVVALRNESGLFMLESQAAWYWPRENIQANSYENWMQWAQNAGYQVTILPLKPEWRAKFNETAAWEFFKKMEGTPYGYHNFLFGWVDTERDSWPPVLSPEVIAPFLSMLESLIPAVGMIFNEAINFRMNTSNLTIGELASVIYEKNLTWPEVYTIPELDEWEYTNGHNLVCSSFVVGTWKAAGLFGDLEINAAEFTPRDAYSMIFIDPNPELPQVCKDTNPGYPWCQIMGDYVMEFPQVSTVAPYARMNERCPSKAIDKYFRPDGC